MPQIIELGVFVSALSLAISSAIVSHVRKTMTSPREAQAATQMMMMVLLLVVLLMLMLLMAHCFQYGFSSGSCACFPAPLPPTLPHPLHTHVSVAKFKQLLPANAFNGKISFVAPNGAVAKVSFCLVSFRFGFFLSSLSFRLFKYSLSLSKRPMSRLRLMLMLMLRLRPRLGGCC